jgi:hypothetical protein
MGVYELSGAGSVKTPRTVYSSMNGNNQFGAMVPIASTTLSANGDVTFTNIPQIYQDLFIVVSARSTQAGTTAAYFGGFNFSYGSNTLYSSTTIWGDGTSATSTRQSNQQGIWADGVLPAASSTSGIYGSMTMHILNYANSSTFKTYLMRCASNINATGSYTSLTVGTWRQTTAISTVYLTPSVSAASGSTFTLYGIRAVSS